MEKDFLEVFFGLEVEKELKALLEDLPEEQAVRGNKTHKRLKKRRKNKTLWYL